MTCRALFLRIVLSMILGFAIGLERQLTGHQVGIRINVLISMGACFFSLLPVYYQTDQIFWIESAVISGVGFLCSGVIFKDNGSVRGINTAATLWCTSAVGILASSDAPWLAISAALVLILSNFVLRPIARKINPLPMDDELRKSYRISITCFESCELQIRSLLIDTSSYRTLFLNNLESGDVAGEKVEVIAEFCSTGRTKNDVLEEIVGKALRIPEVVNAGWEII